MRVCYKRRYTITDFCYRFTGRPILIMGSGPTNYDYSKIEYFHHPIILVNNTINIAKYTRFNDNVFFFTLHIEEFWQRMLTHKHVIHVLPYEHMIIDQYYFKPRQLLNYHVHFLSDRYYPELDRSKSVLEQKLHCLENSMTPAIHFAYLTGCQTVYLVGCSTKDGEYKQDHDNRLGGIGHNVAAQMQETLEHVCSSYNITYKHIGT